MRRVRAQIQELHRGMDLDEQNKTILGVTRRMTELAVKGMAMDPSAMEKVVRSALRESREGPMPLTKSIKDLFSMRTRELASAPIDVSQLQRMLDKRDTSAVGSGVRESDIRALTRHLCNELNSNAPLSKPVIALFTQIDKTRVLGKSIEDWTLSTWKEQFSAYNAKTPRTMDPVIVGLTQLHQKSPSLAQAARPDGVGATELVHRVANHPLMQELGNVETSSQGNVVRALFQGDYESARREVLHHRDSMRTEMVIVGANLDTRELDHAGLSM